MKLNKLGKSLGLLIVLTLNGKSWAGNFDDEWFRVFGRWNGKELMTHNIQLRLPDKELNRGQVSGRIEKIDKTTRTLIIGPFAINWSGDTHFEKITPDQLKKGITLKVSGSLDKSTSQFKARTIATESSPFAPGSLQITGYSGISAERADGIHEFFLLGVPVATPQNGFNTFKSLIRRQDVRRPDDQFKFPLFGKPVTLGGAYDLNLGFRDDFDLDNNDPDGSIRMDQELKLEAFYPISNFTAIFLSFKGATSSRFNIDSSTQDKTVAKIDRDETWIFFDRIANTGFGLQIGNQNVSETRQWWWDKDMDALRLYYNRGPWHFELTGSKQIGGESTFQSISPSDAGVYRILGLASWMWRGKQRLETFFLRQWDRSSHENVGDVLKRVNRDNFDENAVWYGARAIGEIALDDIGSLNYWVDVAGVHGNETVVTYDNIDDTLLTKVDSKHRNKVDGWAFDAGAFWTLPLPYEPTFTLSYAHASGDDNPNDGHDGSFRQTGAQSNKWRFNGVNRFRVYGELFRPELSNLNIFTSAFGIRLLKNSSIEMVYHKYGQVERSNNVIRLRNNNLNAILNGRSSDIGQEFDLVMNFREWKHLELGLIGAVFDPGKGFDSNDLAYSVFFDVNYNF